MSTSTPPSASYDESIYASSYTYSPEHEWDSESYANYPYPQNTSRSDYYPSSSYGGLDTGTPSFGKYAQDGLWDDESDTTTVRRAGSTSTSHTVVTRSPASGLKSSKSSVKKANMAAVASTSSAIAAAVEEGPVWAKTRKASMPGPSFVEADKDKEREHKLDKKKSMSRLMSMGRKVEIAVPALDAGDESVRCTPTLACQY